MFASPVCRVAKYYVDTRDRLRQCVCVCVAGWQSVANFVLFTIHAHYYIYYMQRIWAAMEHAMVATRVDRHCR